MKRVFVGWGLDAFNPAAFRRLCVETAGMRKRACITPKPAAFRRLCVETMLRRAWNVR